MLHRSGVPFAALLPCLAEPAAVRMFVDDARRKVRLPDKVERLLAEPGVAPR